MTWDKIKKGIEFFVRDIIPFFETIVAGVKALINKFKGE